MRRKFLSAFTATILTIGFVCTTAPVARAQDGLTGLYVESVLIEQSEPHQFLAGPFYLPVDVEALAALDVAGNEREEVLIWDGATLYFFDLEHVEAGPQPLAPQPPAPISAMVGVNFVGSERRDLVIADGASLYVLDLDEAIGWMGPVEQPVNITGLTALDVGGSTPRQELIASDGTGLQVLDLDANVPSWQPVDPPPPTSPEVVTTTGIAVVSGDEIVEAFTLLTVINGQNAYVLVEEDGEQFWAGPLYRRFLTLVHSPIDLELQAQTRGAVLTIAAPNEAALSFTDVAADSGLGSYANPGGDGHCPGAVFAEIDKDDLPDLYLVKGFSSDPSTENIMFRNQGNGTFMGVPSAAGANDPRNSVGAVLGDYDNDGDRDLFIVNFNDRNTLYENRDGQFVDVTEQTDPTPTNPPMDLQAGVGFGVSPTGCEPFEPTPCQLNDSLAAAWGDIDRDGDLDLYVGNHLCCGFPQGERDVLYQNNGDGTFTDITVPANIAEQAPPHGHPSTQALIFADFNGDLWPDIYVTHKGNGPSRDALFINDGDQDENWRWDGTFTEYFRQQLNPALGSVTSAAMGIDVGDYDNDGDVDAFLTDIGNMDLYRNRLELGAFALQLPEPNPVPSPRFSWGTSWVDFDNDGDLDLHVATNSGVMDWLHRNDGTHFTDVALAAGAGQAWNSRASIAADFDADGWMDLLVVNRGNIPPLLLANRTAEQIPGAWLKVNLVGDPTLAGVFKSPRDAVGARIEVTVGGVTQQRDIRAGGHTCGSTRSYVAHFGLGSAGGAEQVSVFWPSGRVTTLRDVGAGQTISLVETAPCLADCNGDGNVRVDELVTTTGIALGSTSLVNCLAADRNGDGTLTIDEVVGGVDTALNGCA